MPLPLHVFEERYKEMIGACLESHSPFGVVLIKSGREVGGPAEPHAVGTTVSIARVQRLDDGRMNLMVVGRDRFRIVEQLRTEPYLTARVEMWPSKMGDAATLDEHAERVASLFGEYFRLVGALAGHWARSVDLPHDPEHLADLVGSRLDVPTPMKQELLETATVSSRLKREVTLLSDELAPLRARVTASRRERYGGLGALN
jgi:Lon protease-like protein